MIIYHIYPKMSPTFLTFVPDSKTRWLSNDIIDWLLIINNVPAGRFLSGSCQGSGSVPMLVPSPPGTVHQAPSEGMSSWIALAVCLRGSSPSDMLA